MKSTPEVRRSLPYVSEVGAVLLGLLAVVAVVLQFGPPGSAMVAGGSAAIVGAIALKDTPQGRLRLTLGASLATGGAALLGWSTAPHDLAFIAAVAVWAFGAGMAWALGGNAGLVAAAASALMLTGPAWASFPDALIAAGVATAAGIVQAGLVAIAPRPHRQVRSGALAGGYRLVLTDARRLTNDPEVVFNHGPLITLRQAFTPTDHEARRRPTAFRGMYALPERLGMTLNVLRPVASTPAGTATLYAAADVLEAIADDPPGAKEQARGALQVLDDAVGELPGSAAAAGRRLRRQVSEAAILHFVGSTRLRRPPMAVIREQLNTDSPILRHAVRLAAAVTAGVVTARVTGVPDAVWISLTVLLVQRPETAHTYTRCLARLAAVFVGVGLATTLTLLVHPVGLSAGLLAVLFIAATYAVSGLSYVLMTATVAVSIVFLIDIDGAAANPALTTRLIAVLLGGVLAVASHVLLPDRSLVRLRQRAGELLKAEIDYAATVIRAFAHHLDDREEVLGAMWNRAVRARTAFEAAGGGIRADSAEVRHWLTAYRLALNTVTGVCATLEAQVPTARVETLDLRFVVAVDDYVDALRGEAPSAGQPWRVDSRHLAEADQQLRECAAYLNRQDGAQRVLVSEVEAITRTLLAVSLTGS